MLTREALELVKDWVNRNDLDDDDLKCAEELGRMLFKHWGLKRAARMAPRRTDRNAIAYIDTSHAADDDDNDTHDLFHDYDSTCFKAQDYLAFEAEDFTRSLILAATHQVKEIKNNKSTGDAGPATSSSFPSTFSQVLPVDDASVGKEPPTSEDPPKDDDVEPQKDEESGSSGSSGGGDVSATGDEIEPEEPDAPESPHPSGLPDDINYDDWIATSA